MKLCNCDEDTEKPGPNHSSNCNWYATHKLDRIEARKPVFTDGTTDAPLPIIMLHLKELLKRK